MTFIRLPPLVLVLTFATITLQSFAEESGPFGARPVLAKGVPDLTKGEGPSPAEVLKIKKSDWFLHCGNTHGWAYRDKQGKCDDARQILVTVVTGDDPARRDLKVGDVILGVNGKYFSGMPIYEFRKASLPAKEEGKKVNVILWRKGWDKEKAVQVNTAFLASDFTNGDKPGLPADWNLGATGARGWMQANNCEFFDARQIYITKVEKGSPADGILKVGDAILGVNGKTFDRDARRAFADAITQAETEEGQGKLTVRRWRADNDGGKTEDVTIQIPVMGSYSDTTPWDCKKTDKIVDQACAYLIKKDILNKDRGYERAAAALALMSTGDPAHMALAKGYVYKLLEGIEKKGRKYPPSWGYGAWGWGYHNVIMCEYYLLTKDPTVIPAIKTYSNLLAEGQSWAGAWGHGMAAPNHGRLGGYGALNQPGTICYLSLNLAKRCGVTNPEIEQAIIRGKDHLNHFVDRSALGYGDNILFDRNVHDDNGKTAAAACAFSVLGDTRGTDFFGRMAVASWATIEKGHTGPWFGMLWGPLGAARTGKEGCSAYLKQSMWLFDLERRWDGGFVYQAKVGWGYGVDPKTGMWKGGKEHGYPGRDTTGGRILMYTIPRKRLVISGKDCLETPVTGTDLTATIDAGRPPAAGLVFLDGRYDGRSSEDLLTLLRSWSPVVRYHASLSLAKTDGNHVEALRDMLKENDRYARYGACMALAQQKEKGAPAVGDLIALLKADDQLLQAYAMMGLGGIGNKAAVDALLKATAGEFENDPYGYLHRVTSLALFGKGGPLSKSIEGVDRSLLLPATNRLLLCKGGFSRGLMAKTVLPRLPFDELADLWPNMISTLKKCAPTEVKLDSWARMTVAEILAKNNVEEGLLLILEYMQVQRMHGSRDRNQKIMNLLLKYGQNAKTIMPQLEAYLAFLEKDHPKDTGRFYKQQIPVVKAAIEAIKASKKKPEMTSIKAHLKN